MRGKSLFFFLLKKGIRGGTVKFPQRLQITLLPSKKKKMKLLSIKDNWKILRLLGTRIQNCDKLRDVRYITVQLPPLPPPPPDAHGCLCMSQSTFLQRYTINCPAFKLSKMIKWITGLAALMVEMLITTTQQ